MRNLNLTGVPSTVITQLYNEVLWRWEKELRDKGFSIRSKGFNAYRRSYPISIVSVDTLPITKIKFDEYKSILRHEEKNIFIFYNAYDSQAKSIFFHLRNAIAHAHIERLRIGKTNYYYFEGNKQNAAHKERMKGQIKASILKEFITALLLTAKD